MKELEQHKSELTEVHAIKPVITEKRKLTDLTPQPGQKLWELNLTTRRITEIDIEGLIDVDVKFKTATGMPKIHRKLTVKDNCLYVCAINWKNADKKFFKMLGLKYPKQNPNSWQKK